MADGSFPTLVSKDRNSNSATNVIFVNLSDGTDVLDIDSSGFLTVNVNGTVTVSATDLDIRDLVHTQDSVAIGDGTSTLLDVSIVDSIAGATDNGIAAIAIRDDALTTLTPADGDYVNLRTDSTGALWVTTDDTITVTATDLDIRDLTHASDSVKVGDGTDFLAVNTDGSINVNIVSSVISGEVHDYDTASALGSDLTSNHDYTVVNTTFLLKSIIFSGSGNVKAEIQTGPVASLATRAVAFLNGRNGDTKQINFDPAIEVPVTGTGTVRVIRTNRQGASTDVYSTIIGLDI